MKKNTSIERRWILKDIPSLQYERKVDILQFYSKDFRFRKEFDITIGETKCYKIKSNYVDYGITEEEIYECESGEFLEEMTKSNIIVHKLRNFYSKDGITFEIDIFHYTRMIILKVEGEIFLKELDYNLEIPKEIKSLIILEVTGMKEFSNYNLCFSKKST